MARIIYTDKSRPEDFKDQWERDQIYNGLDCCITREVLDAQLPQLGPETDETYAFSLALQAPVLEMRCRGVLVDQQRKAEVIDELYEKIDTLERNLERIVLEGVGLAGFNWRSNKDLQVLFYDRLGIPVIRKQGRPTVDRNALEKMEAYTIAKPIVAHMSAMRELGKKIAVLKTEIDPDGRMRTSYNIAGTDTGRFSSSFSEFGTGGNLQNIEEGLRSIFIADPGTKWAKCDAKSGESFVVGAIEWNLFNDPRYLEACESGDPHTAVARICWPKLGWTGDLKQDKHLAESPYYRHYTHRFMCKKLGHGCLTADHEVLTRNGWVPISTKPKEIMIWWGQESSFESVQSWADFDYTGSLYEFEGTSVSLLATHDHRIIFKKDRYSPILWEQPAIAGPGRHMPLGNDYVGGHEEVPARLIAAFMADGSQEDGWMCFHFHKERKAERLLDLCSLYGFEVKFHGDKIRVRGSLAKRPGAFQLNWTAKCIYEFVDELKHWDGHIGQTSISISSKHREDLEWFQTLGRLVGIGGNISGPWLSGFGSEIYRLQQNKRIWATGDSIQWTGRRVENVRVYCPTVQSGYFYIRRNGKISITGNSNYGGMPATLAGQAKLPIEVVLAFQPLYFQAFPAHKLWHQWVPQQLATRGFLTSIGGRKRWFWGRRTDPDTIRAALAYDPQETLAKVVNRAMLHIWRRNYVTIMMHDHDALTFQYPEHLEDEIIPQLMRDLIQPIQLKNGRTLAIPYDCKVGWNKGEYDARSNPDGLRDYTIGDQGRRRTPRLGILDRPARRAAG